MSAKNPKENGMEIVEMHKGPVTIIEPRGSIDTSGATPFGDRMFELISSGSRNLVVDLQHIVYISSAGFRALLIAHKRADEAKAKLVLCGVSAEVRRLFDLGRFLDLFTICATRHEGIAKAT
jgi:anti-anti-sigma factor